MATIDRQATTLALAHALSAAERGLAVIPLSRTKLPALRSPHRDRPDLATHRDRPDRADRPDRPDRAAPGGPVGPPCHGECGRFGHGVHDASTDPRRIRELFAAAPWATGYGIACGLPPHHLIGVDLDTKSGTDSTTALRELALRHLFTIPPTVVVVTPSGGRHLWLTGPPDVVVPNSASRLAPGIDIRGAGGYLVGPGSRTDHGVYETAPGAAHLSPAPCPTPLLRLLLPPPRHARVGLRGTAAGTGREPGHGAGSRTGSHPDDALARAHQGDGLIQFVLSAHTGQRNTRLFWAACRAYENGLGPTLTAALIDAAVHTGLPLREARSTVASAARMTPRRPT
ncbi:bifunctional DNA primase/polymerase [Streptomyces sp. C1-2]|uniref:bifunctional DNA primase/polymerase n=1 Tax=Streptomyces sp. C1-2 TaxID=2720022 RepID=UPI00143254A4|nr:bifunctional DNA primase/polymerase [Streptomyces sp. C1-2]NJP70352.1 DNA primase [Streptomyces sp. C1-2]